MPKQQDARIATPAFVSATDPAHPSGLLSSEPTAKPALGVARRLGHVFVELVYSLVSLSPCFV
jgi:hypothetical protein